MIHSARGQTALRQASEPTVEEILESIKKVIARDNRVGAAEERRHREVEGMVRPAPAQPAPDEDVILELAEASALSESEYDAIKSGAEIALEDIAPLLTEDSRSSMRESLAALAMLSEPGVPPQIVRSGETSLEGLVRELLRPALAEWLDRNLPPLVERMVAAEIARIVGKKA